MPKLTAGKMPKYRHHKARGLAVVRINGVDYYLGPWKSKASLVEYDRLIGEWLTNGRVLPQDNEPERLTVVEVIAAYLEFARRYYRSNGKPTSEAVSIANAVKPLKHLYGRQPADEFGPLKLKAVRQQFVANGLTRYTANKNTERIRRMFKWACSEELVPTSVYQSLATVEGLKAGRTEAPESKPIKPVTESDVQAVLPHLSETVADMVRLQRALGCRPAEICILRPCDVDRSGDVWKYRPSHHKTVYRGRERLVFIGPRGQEILRPYLLRAADTYCFSPAEAERKRLEGLHARRRTPLSCGNRPGTNRKAKPKRTKGECYDVASYRRAIHRACDKAFPAPEGLQGEDLARWRSEHRWSPNRLRHSAATEIRRKFGLEAAQVILGHSKADVTQVYAERDYALAARVAAEVG